MSIRPRLCRRPPRGRCRAGRVRACKPPEPVKTPPPVVVVDRPVAQKVNDYEDFAGRTEPFKMVELKSRVTGYLKKIHFKDGQDIEEGKQLFDIDDRTYKAELNRAPATLTKAQRAPEDRHRHLRPREAVVRQRRREQGQVRPRRRAKWPRPWPRSRPQAAAVELAETNLRFCHITAPFDGRLSKRLVDEENLVKADETALTTIVRLDEVYATFDIDERTVMRVRNLIRKGAVTSSRVQPLMVQIALADDDDFTLGGQIVFSDNQIDAGTGTLRRAGRASPTRARPRRRGTCSRRASSSASACRSARRATRCSCPKRRSAPTRGSGSCTW